MSLIACRDGIVAAIKAAIPALKEVKSHAGRFDLAELQRLAAKAPAVRVACLGVLSAKATPGCVEITVSWAAFVIAKDQRGLKRDAAALALITAIMPTIPGNLWGLDNVDAPDKIRADNLYSGKLDQKGVALWGVRWQQDMQLGQLDEATLEAFNTLFVDWDLAPIDGTTDTSDDITLEQ